MIKLVNQQILLTLLGLVLAAGCINPFDPVRKISSEDVDNVSLPLSSCSADQIFSQIFLPSQGSGTSDDPYIICNAFQLQLMGNVDFQQNANVLPGNENLNGYFELGADIDASITSSWNGGQGFVPIGALDTDYYSIGTSAGFSGSFHGNDYTIDGLYINRSRGTVGMFGVIAPFAVVTNLRITNIDVTQNDTGALQSTGAIAGRVYSHLKNIYLQGNVSGDNYTGGLAGRADNAALRNIHASMSVVGLDQTGGMIGRSANSSVINSFFEGEVAGTNSTGGMIGEATGLHVTSIALSSVSANVNGSSDVGGFIGGGFFLLNASNQSFFSGNISGSNNVGGLMGLTFNAPPLFTRVRNSFAKGSIVSTGGSVGGIVGGTASITRFMLENSFSNMSITSGGTETGGIVGLAGIINLENSFASGIINNPGFGISGTAGSNLSNISNVYWFDAGVDVANCYDLGDANCNNSGAPTSETDFYDSNHSVYVNWDFDHVWQSHSNDFPSLRFDPEVNTGFLGSGSEEDPFLIGSVLEWNLISDNFYLMRSYFRLTSNLNFSGSNCSSMIGSSENNFSGILDGDGFSISNFSCDTNIEALTGIAVGLIQDGSTAQIKDLELVGFDINTSGFEAGTLAGRCTSCLIENINESDSTINAEGVSSTNSAGLGGLIGLGDGTSIRNSSVRGSVSGASSIAGGLIGIGSFVNIQNSFASGNVSVDSGAGGLIGRATFANIQNSFASGDISGDDSSRGVSGLIGDSNSDTIISDSFFAGSVSNVSGNAYGVTDDSAATLTNVYWDNTTPGTEASNCHSGGDAGCVIEPDQTQLYLPTHPVYTRVGFAWDFVNIWQEDMTGFPILR